MGFYRTCQNCGAALDPGEICEDCRDGAAREKEKDAHCQPAKQCERLIDKNPPRRITASSVRDSGSTVKPFGKF